MKLHHRFVLPILLITTAYSVSGCDQRTESRGPTRTETRQVEPFDAIEMKGAARLEITVGKPQSVSIEGREAMLSRIDTQVRGGTLHIESRFKDWVVGQGRSRLTIRISVPSLESLKLQGGNDAQLAGFDGGHSTIEAEGAANIEADGRLEGLTVHLAGAGNADLSRLVTEAAKVSVDGVGSVIVHPTDTLEATMNGVGSILYTGNPREVNTRMNGLGTIGRSESKGGEQAEPRKPVDPETLQPEYEDGDPRKAGKT
jgi:Putative auto-transporter adhesin, head GIN domain